MNQPVDAASAPLLIQADRRMVIGAGAAAALVACGPRRAQAQASTTTQISTALDEALGKAFADTAPVALAGSVWREGQLVWAGAKGLRRANATDEVTTSDQWHLGSNTKAMTGALWARLVEQGRAVWDMPVTAAVSRAFADIKVHEGWADRTVEDFMRHRAGLYDAAYVTPIWMMKSYRSQDALPLQRHALAKAVFEAAPSGPLGTYQYGNANYIVVGALMEGLTGQAWEELMRSELFSPLGITSGGFGAPQGAQPWGHQDGRLPVDPQGGNADNPQVLGPAGTAHMNMQDYARFLSAMMTHGWLSEDSLQRLTTPLAGEAYALGWGAPGHKAWAKGPALIHNGSNTMWFATTVIAPARKLAFVTHANDAEKGGDACSALIGQMLETLG